MELAEIINCTTIDRVAIGPFPPGPACGASTDFCTCSMRSIISGEQVVARWLERQIFIGAHLQIEPPIDPSGLLRWRKRLA
ncbi:MAG: transposase [Cytophagaceae bacterium]|nr:MAG: transposase [Cytophagaceae bacterium]